MSGIWPDRIHPPACDRRKMAALLLCFLMGGLFILLFSYSTSPLYPYFWGNDTAQFMTIGKGWAAGRIPYRDLFDHKGPLIYLVDCIGFMIGRGNKAGISLVQFVFLSFTLAAVFEISQLTKKNNAYGILAAAVVLFAMKRNYVEGNTVEEYCLPFLCWSVFAMLLWFRGKREDHPWPAAFLYGVTAGVCLMTRMTNVVPLCGGILVISIWLLGNGRIRNFLQNAAAFLGGTALAVLPFCLYFMAKHCLGEMLYDAFQYNFAYAEVLSSWMSWADGDMIRRVIKNYFVFYIIFLLMLLRLRKKDWLGFAAYGVSAAAETYVFLMGNPYPQYPLICLVHVVLLLNEIVCLIDSRDTLQLLGAGMALWMLMTFLYHNAYEHMAEAKVFYINYHTYRERAWEPLAAEIPQEERDSVIFWGGDSFKETYLLSDIVPCYKYHLIQEWHAGFTEKVRNEIHDTYADGDAKWILTDGDAELIADVLESRYEVEGQLDSYTLYHLK